ATDTDAELSGDLRPHLPTLAGWLASCAHPPAADAEVTVRVVDGAPVLAAWWPRLHRLEVHPALFARVPDNDFITQVRSVPLGEMQPPFEFDGTFADCMTQLDLYCRRCPGGSAAA